MQNINNERWRSSQAVSPNNKINSKTSRSMPQWLQTRGSALPPPPPPPTQAELTNHVDPDYEVIEFSNNQAYINAPIMNHGKGKEGRRCDLCGSSAPSVKCDKCAQQNFCYSCDDMYHRHPKRQSHIRKPLEPSKANFRPPLPPKGENSSAPVPPPRRNKRMSRTSTPGPPEQGFKKDGSLMGSLRRMMGTRPLPPTPTLISRDPRQDKMMEFQDQPPSRDSGYLDWELDSRHRSGSLTALNAPNFAPLMHAQSMAQLNCPSCQHHGMVWDWNHQHNMAGGFNRPPAWNGLPTGTWHGSAMIPQFKQESSMDGFRRNSLRPRRSRRDLASDMSGEEDETMFRRRHTSPARSRRGMVSDFDDSDDDDMRSHKSGRRGSRRRVSPTRNVSPALSRKSSRKLSVEEMINQRLKKNDEDNFPPRGRNYDDQDTVSLRGGRRTDDEVSSNRGGRRYQDDEVTPRRRYDDETMSQRGNSRRNSNVLDDTHSNRGGRRNSEVRRRRDRSPVAKCHVPARSNKEPSSEDSGDELSDENKEPPKIISKEKNGDVVEKEVVKSIEETNGKESATETEEPLGPIPTQQWECDHCTFVNRAGTRVCTVCCKTTSKPKYVDDKKKKEAVTSKQPPLPKQQSVADVDLVKRMDDMSFSDNTLHKDAAPETEEEKRRKKKGPDHDIPDVREKVVASTGTSPPPQSISTQTYDILRPKLRRAASLADHDLWAAPQRSVSRQSLTSDSQSLPLTPSRSQSPGAESLPSWGDLHLKRDVAGARDQLWGDLQSENGNVRNNLQMTRRPSEPALNSRAVVRRAGSQPPEYFNTLVQKQMKQGLEMVKLLREAEDNQFNADELAIALNQCGEGNPVSWLVNNWRNMIDTVVTLATNYGHERKENTVGTISVSEAKEALILHQGNVWAAVTECIEQRQKKYADLMSRGNFTREDIVTVLTANHGNLESAFLELNKNQLKPFLMRIWGPPQGTDNDSGNIIGLQQTDGTEFVEKAKSIDTQESNTSDEVSDENNANEAPRYSQVKSWLETTLSDKDSDRVEKNVLEQQLRKVSMSEDEEYVGTMRLQSIPHKPTNQQLIELAKQQNKWKSESQLLHYYDNEEFISNRKRKKKLREEKAKTVYTDSLGDRNVIERLILDGNIQQVTRHLEDQYRLDEGDQIDYQDNIREQLFNTVLKNADHKRNNERSREVIDDTNLPFVNINEIASKLNLKHVASNDVKSKGKNLKNLLKSYSHDEQDRHSSIEELAIHPQNIRPTIFNAISNASNSPESFNRSEDGTVKSVENGLNLAQMNDIVEPEIVTSSKLIVALDKNMIDKIKSDQLSTKNNVMSENIQINNKQNPQKGNNPLKRSSSLDIKVSTLQIQINGNKNIGKVSSPESVHKSDILNHDTISEANFSNSKQDIDNTNSETVQVNRSEKVEIIPELGIISRDPTNEKYFEDIFVRTVNSSENDTKTTDNEDEDTEEFLDTLQSPIEDIQETANEIIEDNIEEPIVPVNQTSIFISQDLDKNETSDESILYSFPNNDATPISSPSTPISERLLESYSSNSSQKTSSSIAESRAEILDLLKASLSDDQVLDRIVFSLFSNVLGDRTTTSDDPKTKIDTNPNNYKDLSKSPLPAKRLSISSESEINAESEFFEAEEEVESVPLHEAPVTVVPSSNLHELKNQDLDSATANMKVADEQVEVRSAPIETIITPKARDVTLERLKDIVENTVVFKDTNPTITKNNGIERNSSSENIKQNIEDKEQAVKVEHNYKNQGTHEPATLAQQTALQENIIKNVATEDEIEEVETDGEEEIEEHEEEVEEEEEGEVEYEELIEVEENEEKEEEESLQKAEKSEIKENLVIEHEKLVISNREEETDINKEEENSVGEVAKHDDSAAPIDPIKDRERQARRYLAEGFVETYDQAELAVQLMELEFDRELSLSTAKECSSLPAALALLQQECQLCAEKYTMKQMISMLECEHFCCEGCATHYFTLQITERSINDCVCPFCKKPNLDSFDGDQALNYFSNLDIQLKGFLEPAVHELFQRKLRDRTLMQDPNFKWCAKCSSGFIANPRQRRLVCPDCRSITCASCRRPWEKQHEGVSCAEYAAWLEKNDPENQIDQHLAEHGVTCPKCMARYSLSRGGCMHLTCPHCKHEFCSGCANPFVMGAKCTVSEYCAKLGLHAHHPRNCLFYLRDKEPQLLQKLLDDNNVEYKKELPEKEGARCTMQLQRETPDGMIDVVCSQPVIFSALCRTHYIEYLVKQIGQQKLDPVAILDLNEAQQELRRRGKPLPDRPGHLTDHDYLKLCAKIVKEEIPLE